MDQRKPSDEERNETLRKLWAEQQSRMAKLLRELEQAAVATREVVEDADRMGKRSVARQRSRRRRMGIFLA